MIIAWRALSVSGRATSQSPLTQASVAEATPVVFAHAPAGEDHGPAGNKARIAAFFHLTGKINARHHRKLTDNFAFAGDRRGRLYN